MSIKVRVPLVLMRIGNRLHYVTRRLGFSASRKAWKLHYYNWEILNHKLIQLTDPSPSDLLKPHFNEVISLAATRLMYPDFFDTDLRDRLHKGANYLTSKDSEWSRILVEYEKNKHAVNSVVEAHHNSEIIRSILAKAFQIRSYLNAQCQDHEAEKIFIEIAKRHNPRISDIDASIISTELRSARSELRTLRQTASMKQAIKIELSSEHLITIISISSGLFLVSGFFYSRSILGHFGVEVADYFSLSDYVAASIEGIRYSLFATIFAIIGGFLGIHNRSRLSYRQSKAMAGPFGKLYLLFVVIILSATIHAYFAFPSRFYNTLILCVMVSSPKLIIWAVRRYFVQKHGRVWYFIIQSILLFSLHLHASVKNEIYRIESTPFGELKRYDIVFDESVTDDLTEAVLIASNSRYLFLRDGINKKTYILPTSQVKSISVRQ